MKRRLLMQAIGLACLAACLAPGLAAGQASTEVVEAKSVLAADGAYPGSSLQAAVVAQVSPGYHINDNKPALDYLIPTELKFDATKPLRVGKIAYPKGEAKRFAFSDTPLSVYEGTVVIGALLKVAPAVRPGTYTVKGKLVYQACNDHACLPPTSAPFTLAVRVVRRGAPVKRVNADVFHRIQFD